MKNSGTDAVFYVDYPPLYDSANPGDPILLDDGNVVLVRVCVRRASFLAICGVG